MPSESSQNGNHPALDERPEPVNAYADALTGSRPREIAQFELNTDPYANMLPRISAVTDSGDGESRKRNRKNPVVVAVSVLLIAVLVLPIMAEVFARLIH